MPVYIYIYMSMYGSVRICIYSYVDIYIHTMCVRAGMVLDRRRPDEAGEQLTGPLLPCERLYSRRDVYLHHYVWIFQPDHVDRDGWICLKVLQAGPRMRACVYACPCLRGIDRAAYTKDLVEPPSRESRKRLSFYSATKR